MNRYVREVRGVLESLGIVSRSDSPWLGGFLFGAGFGVVAGAAVAVLLTPTDGKEMRKLVRSKAKRLARTAEKQISAIKSSAPNGAKESLHA